MPTHQITVTVWSEPKTPNWYVEKTVTEAVENVWSHPKYGHVQAEVTNIEKVATDPIVELVDSFLSYLTE